MNSRTQVMELCGVNIFAEGLKRLEEKELTVLHQTQVAQASDKLMLHPMANHGVQATAAVASELKRRHGTNEVCVRCDLGSHCLSK